MDSTVVAPCPSCSSYKVYPGCSNPDCDTRWCARAECMWSSGECNHEKPELHPWNLEQCDMPLVVNGVDMGLVEKEQLRGIVWCGMDVSDDEKELKMGHISVWRELDDPEKAPWTARNLAIMIKQWDVLKRLETTDDGKW